jgi:TonB family protein
MRQGVLHLVFVSMPPVLHLSRARCIFLLFCVFFLLPALHAQSTKADIETRLKDKPLYLRGFWREDKLRFDSNGQLIGKANTVTFTICGFDLKSIDLKPDKLILVGTRIGLELADNQQKRVPLDGHVHIEIAAGSNGDYGPALDSIFADGLDKLVPTLPSYWKSYAEKNFLPAPATTPANPSPQSQDTKSKGAVSPPKILSSAQPFYNSVARSKNYAGTVLVNFWVEPDGTTSHLSIRQALGLGMDEDALAAAQRYIFKPAMQDGKPVLVELNVAISFSLP